MSAGSYICSSFMFINLGCEMIYILINRLKAQKVQQAKANRIISQITTTVFKQKFIKDIMLPQQCLSIITFKDIFKRLAHSSIMKLDSTSMQKLFYLMLLTFKLQIFRTCSPLQLYSLTINHLECLKAYTQSIQVRQLIQNVINIFKETASTYSFLQYLWIKQQLLSIMENYQTRIITFIDNGYQNQKGNLIHQLRFSNNLKSIGTAINQPDIQFIGIPQGLKNLNYQKFTLWKTSLGANSYQQLPKMSLVKKQINSQDYNEYKIQGNNQMRDILKINKQSIEDFNFTLDLFQNNSYQNFTESSNTNKIQSKNIIDVKNNDISKKINQEFNSLQIKDDKEQQIDLLDLMDS